MGCYPNQRKRGPQEENRYAVPWRVVGRLLSRMLAIGRSDCPSDLYKHIKIDWSLCMIMIMR
jgi:hypothetical protein